MVLRNRKEAVVVDKITNTTMRSNRSSSTRELYKCVICDRNHALRFCPEFILMRVEDRRKVVRENDHCLNCLARSHQVRRCHSKVVCKKCGSQHHSMLHPESSASTDIVRHASPERSNVHDRVSSPGPRNSSNYRSKRRRQHQPKKKPTHQSNKRHKPSHQPQQHQQQSQRQHQQRQQPQNRQKSNRQKYHQQNHFRNNNQHGQRNNNQTHRQPNRSSHPNTASKSVLMPDQLVLSQAIKSLAEVMCVASSVAQVQGRRHGQI
ncbi:uncharacterized protein [Musca autumnalis]|uniref:uncharacterized protein n=1 Tax=Musca autumnalis TaxID=221902 RepID=UPI003CE9A7C7